MLGIPGFQRHFGTKVSLRLAARSIPADACDVPGASLHQSTDGLAGEE